MRPRVATRRAYDSDLGHSTALDNQLGLTTIPAQPQTVALVLAAQENTLSSATLVRPASHVRRAATNGSRHRPQADPAPGGGPLNPHWEAWRRKTLPT